jgi:hypothetical protein
MKFPADQRGRPCEPEQAVCIRVLSPYEEELFWENVAQAPPSLKEPLWRHARLAILEAAWEGVKRRVTK